MKITGVLWVKLLENDNDPTVLWRGMLLGFVCLMFQPKQNLGITYMYLSF